jgi:hypothetical protein
MGFGSVRDAFNNWILFGGCKTFLDKGLIDVIPGNQVCTISVVPII